MIKAKVFTVIDRLLSAALWGVIAALLFCPSAWAARESTAVGGEIFLIIGAAAFGWWKEGLKCRKF